MTLEYLPGGRWVRVISLAGHRVQPVGTWHRATVASLDRLDRDPDRIDVDCERELHAGLLPDAELLFTTDLPLANVCKLCRRVWLAEQARDRHGHLALVRNERAAARSPRTSL